MARKPPKPPLPPVASELMKFEDLTYCVSSRKVWVPSKWISGVLGINEGDLLAQLEHEDTRSSGGRTCIASFGISTAVAMAKQADFDTSDFEAKIARLEQDFSNHDKD